MLGNIVFLLLLLLPAELKKNLSGITSKSLDPDQAFFVRPDPSQNILKGITLDNTGG